MSEHIERAVLTICLTDGVYRRRARSELTPEDFTDPRHRLIFNRLGDDVAATLSNLGKKLADAGGKAYVTSLSFNEAVDVGQWGSYTDALKAARGRSKAVEILRSGLALAADPDTPIVDLVAHLKAVDGVIGKPASASMGDALSQAIVSTFEASERGNNIPGYPTGLHALDRLMGGLETGHVSVIMGEAGVGKSALALQLLIGASRAVRCGYVSLEMDLGDVGQRLQALESGVSLEKIRAGSMSSIEQRAVDRANNVLDKYNISFAPITVGSWADVESWIVGEYFTYGTQIFCVDNLLSLDYAGREEMAHVIHVANRAPRLAREYGIGIVLVHHTNTDERPGLRSMHGSKAVQRLVSNIFALWKNPDNLIEFIKLKGRNSALGSVHLTFDGERQRFKDAASLY